MAIYNFPEIEKSIIESEASNKISKLTNLEQEKEKEINSHVITKKSKDPFGDFMGMMGFAAIISFFACVCTCVNDEHQFNKWIYGLESFITVMIISLILIVVFSIVFSALRQNSQEEAEKKVSYEKNNLAKEIGNIKLKAQEEYAKYSMDFEREAQNQSVKFADSELAKEVIEWMTTGFSNTIKSADRREHINSISVPFEFKVFKDKITCAQGAYDFNIKRCSYLESPVEQAALARALAAAIQLNIVMDFPEDPSGTAINVSLSYVYTHDSANATLHYKAPNGYYQAVKKWS